MQYSYKLVRQISEHTSNKAVAFALEAVLAALVDRFKFNGEKLELLMKDVSAAINNKDVVTRDDLKEIVKKYTGLEV